MCVKCDTKQEEEEKRKALNLLEAFALAIKHELREEDAMRYVDCKRLVQHVHVGSPSCCLSLATRISYHVQMYLYHARKQGKNQKTVSSRPH